MREEYGRGRNSKESVPIPLELSIVNGLQEGFDCCDTLREMIEGEEERRGYGIERVVELRVDGRVDDRDEG